MFYPLELLAGWITYSVFNIAVHTHLANALSFFIADVLKIFILLAVIIFAVSLIRSYLPPEKIRKILSHKNKYVSNILAAMFGIITPFCSCSAIPLFLGFVQAGVPLGVTFSFLVSSPMINEVALILIFGLFGWKIALIYIISGLLIAIISGVIIGQMKVESLVEPFVYENLKNENIKFVSRTRQERIKYATDYTLDIIGRVWFFILIGVALGAWIHGYVPADFLAAYAGADKWYAVPLAVLIGIPLYSNAAGIIPLVGALTEKGVAMGTTFSLYDVGDRSITTGIFHPKARYENQTNFNLCWRCGPRYHVYRLLI